MNQHEPRDRFLTHADLEQLEIPAERVDQWLEEGSLERLTLLQFDDHTEPSYVVHSPELTEILEQGLQTIERHEVILDPDLARAELAQLLEEQDAFATAPAGGPSADTTDAAPTPVREVAGSLAGGEQEGQWCDLPNLAEDDLFRHVTAEDPVNSPLEGPGADTFDPGLAAATQASLEDVEVPADILSDVEEAFDSLLSDNDEQRTQDGQLAALMADQPATDQDGEGAGTAAPPVEGRDGQDHETEILFEQAADHEVQTPAATSPTPSTALELETLAEPLRQIDLTVRMLAERSTDQPDLSKVVETIENGFASLLNALPQAASLQSIDNQLQELRVSVNRLAASPRPVAEPKINRVPRRPRRQRQTRSHTPTKTDATLRKMVAATLMLMGWVGLLWSHTIGTKFAAVTFVAANVLGCLLLTQRTDRRN